MAEDNSDVNMPAAAWAWLTEELARLGATTEWSFTRDWDALRHELDGQPTRVLKIGDWPSDFWVAKSQGTPALLLGPVWSIPDRIDRWPLLELDGVATVAHRKGVPTNGGTLLDRLASSDPTALRADAHPAHSFLALSESTARDDPATISAGQVRAWLTTALGDLLMGIPLTPVDDEETHALVVRVVVERLGEGGSPGAHDGIDFGCESLYSSSMTEDGPRRAAVRQGQGTGWQHHWEWLSRPQTAREMITTVQLAGRLLADARLLAGLTIATMSGDDEVRRRALCVIRRWLLTTKVLAWLFEALHHDWAEIRPQDLACFAFGALAPTWPRRTMAVSHRSAEAKPVLATLQMWNSPHAAIDARCVPAWETNTGMIWSLFAAVPLILRVGSATYLESEWCRREHEMLQYLVDRSDFLEGRRILDVGVDTVAELDGALFDQLGVHLDNRTAAMTASIRDTRTSPPPVFPPWSDVLVGRATSELDLAVLRAGGALRLLNAWLQQPAATNALVGFVMAGQDLGLTPPTNNPDGWAAYRRIFQDLQALLADEPSVTGGSAGPAAERPSAMTVPESYAEQDLARDRRRVEQIPDLSDGRYRLADVLAAWEWQQVVVGAFLDDGLGDKVIVDVTELSVQEWTSSSALSIGRGLLALFGRVPVWIMQRRGQDAHTWPGFRNQPIFTRYRDDQFDWLKPVFLDPSWLIYYTAASGFTVGPELQFTVVASVVRAVGSDALRTEDHDETVRVHIPTADEFFLWPRDALQQAYGPIEEPERPPD